MTEGALDVLAEVHRHGGDVKVVPPDRLRVLAPPALLPQFVQRVRAVKAELLLVLAAQAKEWRGRYAEAVAFWQAFHPPEEAAGIAWGELQWRWHQLYGASCAPGICAGCGGHTRATEALPLCDGTSVHITTLDCLIAYGRQWRSAADAGLTGILGFSPPENSSDS